MGAQMGTIVPSMSYHTFQQRSCPGKMGGMPVYGAHSNGPIQPSTMAVVTNGGGNRFSVENYLPSAAPPVPHPIRYTPSDLNLSELLHEKPGPPPREWLGPPIPLNLPTITYTPQTQEQWRQAT